jgi:uncharacterized membrane protein
MQKSKMQFKTQKLISPLLIIFFAVSMRFLPHPPNFAPIAAMALFGGVYLNKKYALIAPLLAMFISDIFLGFHSTIFYVYFSFILTGLIGLYLKKHKKLKNIIGGSLTASILFFLITNFGVWAQGMYARDISGLLQSYIMGLPFFRNSLLGDLFYVGLFFGSYEFMRMLIPRIYPNKTIRSNSH